MSIEEFKRAMENSAPAKGSRPLRDIDMTKRTEKHEPASPAAPESDADSAPSE